MFGQGGGDGESDTHGRRRRLSRMRARFRDRSLTVLLAVQLLLIFGIGPLLSLGVRISPSLAAFALLAVVFAVIVAAPSVVPMLAVIAALLFNAAAALLLRLPEAGALIDWADAIGSVLSIAGLSWVVIQVVFSPGPIDRHRIVGAVVLYLNVALLFESLYRLIAALSPGAFTGLPPVFEQRHTTGDLIYFSLVTLTTVGYGDITPVHPIARSLANMEALIGQLYPAIILARIMTLYRTERGR